MRTSQNNAAGPVGVEAAQNSKFSSNYTEEKIKARSKSESILSVLKSGTSLHRFSAEPLGDHCLPSTISELRGKGHKFSSEWITVPTRFDKPVRVKLYRYVGAVGDGAA